MLLSCGSQGEHWLDEEPATFEDTLRATMMSITLIPACTPDCADRDSGDSDGCGGVC